MFMTPTRKLLTFVLPAICLALAACGGNGSSSSTTSSGGGGTTAAAVPHFSHVAVVVLENASYNEVIGNSSMPYLNKLASQGSLLQSYYANAHPSIPNYFMLTTGQPVTFDDAFSGTVSVDNLAREFMTSAVSWKAYEEGIPSAGYTAGDSGLYIERHNPFSYFSDVRNSSTESGNIVPFTQLSADMSGSLPNFLWLGPNAINSAHSCPSSNPNCTLNDRLAAADAWLSTNIQPLLSNSAFSSNGLLIIVFDEGDTTDVDHGGGHIVGVLAGAHVKTGYASTATYQHQDILSLIGHALQLQTIPGAGASGGSMTEFFQ
jgi:acid phosphatase